MGKKKRRDTPVRRGASPRSAEAIEEAPATRASGALGAVALFAGLAVAAVAVGVIWAEPRPVGDLFTALAVGRDVVDGKLGKPDDWAFTTQGRVCLNQNWGSHLLHYAVYQAAGPMGLLVLKALMIAAAALFVSLAARQRGVRWPVALLAAAGAIAAGRAYIDLRPNLTTLVLSPLLLFLLWKTRRQPHWMWAVMLVNAVWANAHGGFVFGLGTTGLWAGVWTAQRTIERTREGAPLRAALRAALVQLWPIEVGALGSVALAALANPYGPKNLTFPFTIRDPAWQPLSEWRPLLAPGEFGSAWEFLLATGLLLGLLLLRAIGIPGIRASNPTRPRLAQASMAAFDAVLMIVLVSMTFTARRFVPLSAILLAPVFAVQLEWLVRSFGTLRRAIGSALVIVMAGALIVPLLVHARSLWRLYRPENPRYARETVFERMHGVDEQPIAAAQFLAANRIGGRVFNDWRWESYLHWTCPQLECFIGGRAHSVYDASVVRLAGQILADPRVYAVDPAKDLSAQRVRLVVVPIDEEHDPLISHLTAGPGATWGALFFDGRTIVVADAAWPETAELLRGAAGGTLAYPDRASALTSRAVALTAAPLASKPADVLEAFLAAADARPLGIAYDVIRQASRSLPDPASWQKTYFRRQYARLERMDVHQADGMRLLPLRAQLAQYLAELSASDRVAAQQTGQREAATRAADEQARWVRAQEEAEATLRALDSEWP